MRDHAELISGIIVSILVVGGILISILPSNDSEDTTTPASSYTESSESNIEDEYVESDYTRSNGTDDCTVDCSGHSAGYEWAEDNDICDPEYEDGNSESFNEGVREWAYDNCYYGDEDSAF